MSVELKVKEKSLAEEARIIRHEEKKAVKSARWHRERQEEENTVSFERTHDALYRHRIDIVRFEARATNLARAYIKGTPYKVVERSTRDGDYQMGRMKGRVEKLVRKYNDKALTAAQIEAWFEA